MKNACIVVSGFYGNNKLFDLADESINRNNCMYPFFCLKKGFKKHNINLSTQDLHAIENSDIVIYNEMPETLPKSADIEKSYLIIFESDLIRPDNWDADKHQYFHKIFTWNDSFVDNIKYFKINFAFDIPQNFRIEISERLKFCTLIAGNKHNKQSNELYSERIRAIQWFEENHPNDFDLYGMDWDRRIFRRPFGRLNKFRNLQKIFAIRFKSYRGMIGSKFETLSNYKFSICYENAKEIPGYITEKIFDCFLAGTVPVYWGASNIHEFIPKNCYIDRTRYSSYDALYTYMKNMSLEEYSNYLKSIEAFINSDKILPFSAECFADTIITNVVKEN